MQNVSVLFIIIYTKPLVALETMAYVESKDFLTLAVQSKVQ